MDAAEVPAVAGRLTHRVAACRASLSRRQAGAPPGTAGRPASQATTGKPLTAINSSRPARQSRSGSKTRMAYGPAPLPAALAAQRQRSSADDLNPGAAAIGVPPWGRAARGRRLGSACHAGGHKRVIRQAQPHPARSPRLLPSPAGKGDHRRCRRASATPAYRMSRPRPAAAPLCPSSPNIQARTRPASCASTRCRLTTSRNRTARGLTHRDHTSVEEAHNPADMAP